jgi:DNA (cytosine-5)-methyltransferase 1
MPLERPTAIELFCGAGGMGLGFEQAGFDVLAAVDLDPVHLAVHERNFPMCESVCGDVSELQAENLSQAARRGWDKRQRGAEFVGPVDCVFGGPSCQGFSVIGRQDPKDPRNALVSEFARVVLALRPRWFVMENVPGLVSPNYSGVLEAFYEALEGGGFRVAKPWVLNARDFGVPQERKRVFIVGARGEEKLPSPPSAVGPAITVGEAIADLSSLGRFRRLYGQDELQMSKSQWAAMFERQSRYVRTLNGIDQDDDNRADPRKWDPLKLRSVGLTRHSDAVIQRLGALKPGERDEVGRLPRLDLDSQSPTLRAGTGRDHGSFTSARPVHPSAPRVITVREAARLHGFPDWFGFHSTKWHGFRQVGNAVPPLLARAVAASIVDVAGVSPMRRNDVIELGQDELLSTTMNAAAEHFGLDSSYLPADIRRGNTGEREVAA